MRRAQSMAHAALRRPAMLSSWSCIGPRRRTNAMLPEGQEHSSESPINAKTSDPLMSSPRDSTLENLELPLSSSEGLQWDSGIGCSYSDAKLLQRELDVDVADGEDIIESPRDEDLMTEVELWQQLEHELYDRAESEVDVEKEIREEEKAAMEEVGATQPEGSTPEVKEAHRFFPAGKIMHIITLREEETEEEGSVSSSDSGSRQSVEAKVGIFLTPRELYSKLRLSHSMISDHLMPIYRRQIEKVIKELEKEASEGSHDDNGTRVQL